MFDTLAYVSKLKESGLTEEQAKAHAEAMVIVVEDLATKRDLREIETSLRHDMKEMELKFEGRFMLINWMLGAVFATNVSLIFLVLKYLIP